MVLVRYRTNLGACGRWLRECDHNDNQQHKYLVNVNRKRARRLGASGHFTEEQLANRIAFFFGKCAYCGGPYQHLDHAIALAKGGTNWPANLRPSCQPCNNKKKDQDWRRWKPLI